MRVVGPHGACDATLGCQLSPPDSWLRYDSLLLIGGGVGVSAGRDAASRECWSAYFCAGAAVGSTNLSAVGDAPMGLGADSQPAS